MLLRILLTALLLASACARGTPGLVVALEGLPADVGFAARLEPARLGPGAVVGPALEAFAEAFGGPVGSALAPLLGRARAITVLRRDPPPEIEPCARAMAHVTELLRVASGGQAPGEAEVAGTRTACQRFGLSGCLLAARSPAEVVACATAGASAGEPWGVVLDGLPDAAEVALDVAGALGLRVASGVPRYADPRHAVHPVADRLVVGQPALVRAVVDALEGRASTAAGGPFADLARDVPASSALQVIYRGLGTPPSLHAAALGLGCTPDLHLTWRLVGAAGLQAELEGLLPAMAGQLRGGDAAWLDRLTGRLRLAPEEAARLQDAVSNLAASAILSPRPGGVAVQARAAFDVPGLLARVRPARATPR